MNQFIDVFKDLLDVSRWVNPEIHYKAKTVEVPRKFLFFKLKPGTNTILDTETGETEQAKTIETILRRNTDLFSVCPEDSPYTILETRKYVSFDWMWQFCEFVLFAEHVVLYPNSSNKKFRVLEVDEGQASFIIESPEYYRLHVGLEKTASPLGAKGRMIKSIVVTLKQEWKDDKLEYLYFDEIAPIEDTELKDQYFSKNISDLIYDTFYDIFKSIINSVTAEYGVKLD